MADLAELKLLAAIPEWEVPLKGGARSSFTDVLAIASNSRGLCTIAVEAKAGEDFGPTLASRLAEASEGQTTRIQYLQDILGTRFDGTIRYQLLHRTASALLVARDFHATTTVMLVHAWKSTAKQKADFVAFTSAMGAEACSADVSVVARFGAPRLYLAWCEGDPRFLEAILSPGI